jgi:hypothetical protein
MKPSTFPALAPPSGKTFAGGLAPSRTPADAAIGTLL